MICLFVIFLIIGFAIEILLRKLLRTDRKALKRYGPINDFQKRGELFLLIIFLFILAVQVFLKGDLWFGSVLIYFVVSTLFRGFIEWKYDRQSKEYIITLVFLIFTILFLVIIKYFDVHN